MSRGRTRAVLALGLLVGPGALGTSAFFTDRASVTGTTVTADAMSLDLPGTTRQRGETYTWSALNLTGLAAGDSRSASLTVTNNSARARFTYRVSGPSTSTTLTAALKVSMFRDATASNGACTGGTAVSGSGVNLVGSVSLDIGPVAAGGTSTFCVQVSRPSGTTLAAGLSSPVTFTFDAKQVQ